MSEHSIEELKRQRDSARSKWEEANKAYGEAKARLQAALLNNSGWMNQVIEVNGERALVRDVEFSGDTAWRLMVSTFRKDGTPSLARRARYLSGHTKVTKLGEYKPEPSP